LRPRTRREYFRGRHCQRARWLGSAPPASLISAWPAASPAVALKSVCGDTAATILLQPVLTWLLLLLLRVLLPRTKPPPEPFDGRGSGPRPCDRDDICVFAAASQSLLNEL
jgi:hypothetical protein